MLALLFAVPSQAFAKASLSITITPSKPAVNALYTLTIKGKASKGHLGRHNNRTVLTRFEQFGGTCASTPQEELAQAVAAPGLNPVYLKKGKFKINEPRQATPTTGTTIRFCAYLSSKATKVTARATAAYST